MGVGFHNKISDKYILEIFGGYGLGNVKNSYAFKPYVLEPVELFSQRVFFQPSIGFSRENTVFSFTLRYVANNISAKDNLSYTSTFIEPVITGRVGFRNLMLIAQFGYSFRLFESYLNFSTGYEPLILSLGIHFSINRHP